MPAHTPEDCDRLFADHVNAGDIEAVLSLYEAGGCYVLKDGVAAGPEAIRPSIAQMIASKARLVCLVAKVVRAGEDLALLYNDWMLAVPQPDGRALERAGKALELVRRQADGTWRFVVDDPHGRS